MMNKVTLEERSMQTHGDCLKSKDELLNRIAELTYRQPSSPYTESPSIRKSDRDITPLAEDVFTCISIIAASRPSYLD
ncbi:hypothetical protein J6590_000801 [Homalodisca vitripennis]|nr:hypothetical protein J6590_000801 [Homalodisca vitripennis]